MKAKDFAELLLLGAIWGASFMLMKEAVPAFGVFALVEFRAIGATLCLLPLVFLKKQQVDLIKHWKGLFVVGLLNTAIPFSLFNYAMYYLDAGLAAILNATAPMFGVIVAWLYLKEKIGYWGVIGILLGFVGVVIISVDPSSSSKASLLPILAALGAAICYAIAASYMKRHLSNAKPFAVAAGSQIASIVLLLPFAITNMPSAMPDTNAWIAATVLAVICTGLAYVMYFDLIDKVGPSKAIAVGYLLPFFGIMWGVTLLDETLTLKQIIGSGCVIIGVLMVTNAVNMLKQFRISKSLALNKSRSK
ncbi:MAG: EamA family transporter [Pseudomonadota bacterium]